MLKHIRSTGLIVLGLVAAGPGVVTLVEAQQGGSTSRLLLTGPNQGSPLEVALRYVWQNRSGLGLRAADIAGLAVKNHYRSRHSGVTHIVLRQRLNGVEVFNADININIARDGAVVNLGNQFVSNLRQSINTEAPTLSPREAVQNAARDVGLTLTAALDSNRQVGGPSRAAIFSPGGISRDPIPVRLMYEPLAGLGVRLVWNVVLRLHNDRNWWNIRVDAVSGEVISKNDWVVNESVEPGPAMNGDAAVDRSGEAVAASSDVTAQQFGGEYFVVPAPFEFPLLDGASFHSLVSDPADASISPFGWHDTNGLPGNEFTDTRGNNVFAQEDTNANNSGGFRPDGGPALSFDFSWDPQLQPDEATNQEAAIVNLFYWNNVIHDVFHRYGFDEPSGNFQQNNYGNGGLASDPVQADAQDGSGLNNANFSTPPDGFDPRMQMFIWTSPTSHTVTVNSPAGIAGDYTAGGALFGPSLDEIGITGDVVLVNDGVGTASDGCQALINGGAIAGNIALVDRGSCNFTVKVKNAQLVGAVAAIVVNNVGDGVMTMGGSDPTVVIPSVFIGQSNGTTIKGELGGGVNATLKQTGGPPDRDSDLDNGIIVHEYGHGVSNRLTGGPGNSSCLFNQEQMGEGWSDWLALVMTAKSGDQGGDPRPIGSYVIFEHPALSDGIRSFPYSTDTSVNPHTYDDIKTESVPHGVGSVWSLMLWEMYWNLVDVYGFDPDIYQGTGGKNLALQLVMDGMKLQPCSPHFVDGRNAILTADVVNNGGVNQCLIWEAFAKRGLGLSANAGSSLSRLDGTEAFDIPPGCVPPAQGDSE